jgi:hypothetical protein
LIVAVIVATVAPAAAQERPFLFSVTTAPEGKPAVRLDYDVGVGERAFQSMKRLGIERPRLGE